MKIKTHLLDLLEQEVYAVFRKGCEIFVLGKQKIKNIVFAKDGKVGIKTTDNMFMDEDICMDLEQVKARIEFLKKTIIIEKPKQRDIILPK